MEMGVECKNLSTLMDQKFPFMEEDQVRSKGSSGSFLRGWFNSEVKNTFLKYME